MGERVLVATTTMAWENGLDVVRGMTEEFRNNLGPAGDVERVYQKYNQKTLRIDPSSTRRIDLIRIDAGYRDLTNAYHDSVEECLVLGGAFSLDGEGDFRAGDYFWRPPGWVHAAETAEGFTALLMLQGEDHAERSGRTSRRIRPDHEAGTNQLYPGDHDRAIGPRGWVRCLPTSLVAWQPGLVYARAEGTFDGFDLPGTAFKVLSRNPWTGAQSLLVRLDAGYAQRGPGRHTVASEWYVLEGACTLGDEPLGAGTYLYRPAGAVEAPLRSEQGATLFMKADGWLDWQPQ